MAAEGEYREDAVKMLSSLFYSIKFLGCTYAPELEQMLFKYDSQLAATVQQERRKSAAKKSKQQQQQQQQ